MAHDLSGLARDDERPTEMWHGLDEQSRAVREARRAHAIRLQWEAIAQMQWERTLARLTRCENTLEMSRPQSEEDQ